MRDFDEEKNERTENKVRIPVWIYPSSLEEIDKLVESKRFKSRSEFIDEASRFYAGYLSSESAENYLPEVMVEALRATLKASDNRMAKLLFKLSVEVSMVMNVLAAGLEIQPESLDALRARCVRDVKKSNGSISFKDAIKLQQGDPEE